MNISGNTAPHLRAIALEKSYSLQLITSEDDRRPGIRFSPQKRGISVRISVRKVRNNDLYK
jgi:hypothetical protein